VISKKSVRPVVAISVGCPSGIGPEVALAAASRSADAWVVLVGDRWVLERAASLAGVSKRRLVSLDHRSSIEHELGAVRGAIGHWAPAAMVASRDAEFGRPTPGTGRAELAWIDQATELAASGAARALVTGPVSKHAIAASGGKGRDFRGHTEHLAQRLGAREIVMAFWAERLVISLVTTHLPLAEVASAITPAKVSAAIFLTARLVHRLGKKRPRIVVAGVNPHAGEQGLLGEEEISKIAPGIALAKKRLARARLGAIVEGPTGAETAVRKAHAGAYDAVVAMYHDQATIPMKLVGFGDAVNVTLGLPIVRTSVDHGTGYDIAGQGVADARGMTAAIALAVRLTAKK
jgi:4-hydroxythreonine-4-phosphate dehydrogenase